MSPPVNSECALHCADSFTVHTVSASLPGCWGILPDVGTLLTYF